MVLKRWDPFDEFRRMDQRFNRLWRGHGIRELNGHTRASWTVPLDVVQEDDKVIVRATVPGVDPKDIDVTIEDGVLTLKGQAEEEREVHEGAYLMRERGSGAFRRAVRLPDTVDTEKGESRYEHGVLTITFPKEEARKARRLEISVGKN